MTYIIDPSDQAPDGAHVLVINEAGVAALETDATEKVILDVAKGAVGEIGGTLYVVDENGVVLARLTMREGMEVEERDPAVVLAAAQVQLGAYGSTKLSER